MPFDLENLVPEGKFHYPGSPDEWVLFRGTTDELIRDLRNRFVSKDRTYYVEEKPGNIPNAVHGVEFLNTDDDGMFRAMWDWHIKDWNLKTPGGDPIPCTIENKLRLLKNSQAFSKFCADSVNRLDADTKERTDRELKNSKTSPKPGGPSPPVTSAEPSKPGEE